MWIRLKFEDKNQILGLNTGELITLRAFINNEEVFYYFSIIYKKYFYKKISLI
jgi:hypothetical protein